MTFGPPGLQKPSAAALGIAFIPFAAMCFTVSFWDRVYPMVLGLPFNFFWLLLWILLTPACLLIAYRVESKRDGGAAK